MKISPTKIIGWLLLCGGGLWAAYNWISVSMYTHSLWIWTSQSLPQTEQIEKAAVISAMRDFSLKMNDTLKSLILLPSLTLLLGGLFLGISKQKSVKATNGHQT